MIKYLLFILLLIYLIGDICYRGYSESFENRTLDYSINVIPHKDSKESNKYIFYKNKKQIVESDLCEWNSKKCLKSIVKHNFNNNFDDVEIKKDANDYTYKIILDGKKKHNYKIIRNDINKYLIYDNDGNKLYEVYRSIIDNKETITIRNNNFDKYAIINYDTNVYSEQYPNYKTNGLQFKYKTTHFNFNNQEILGYSIFKVIQEINREFFN
jgi:hypothetical protein